MDAATGTAGKGHKGHASGAGASHKHKRKDRGEKRSRSKSGSRRPAESDPSIPPSPRQGKRRRVGSNASADSSADTKGARKGAGEAAPAPKPALALPRRGSDGTGAGAGAGAGAGSGDAGTTPAAKPKQKSTPARRGRPYTVSVALPGSIIDNAQSFELQSYLTSQIARALAIFCVDEVVLYTEAPKTGGAGTAANARAQFKGWDPTLFLARLLQYQETPQYLRRALIPKHKDLRSAGLLNPLDSPHHMRHDEPTPFREGVVVSRPCTKGSYVNVGIYKDVRVPQKIRPGVRVTVEMKNQKVNDEGKLITSGKMKGVAVSAAKPREEAGIYWGYSVRVADCLSDVFAQSPFKGGYDVTIGTSERGNCSVDDEDFTVPAFRHLLIVFGGVLGIEASVDADEALTIAGEDASCLFDMWVNTCPNQGSRTIRTEEAIPITMAALRSHIVGNSLPTTAA